MPRTANAPVLNKLLAALPRKSYQRLLPSLELVDLSFGTHLYAPGGKIKHVYFPNIGIVSLLTEIDGKKAAEVGLVGSEGVVGLSAAFGFDISNFSAIVQGSGTALRLPVTKLVSEVKVNSNLRQGLFGATHLLMVQIAQTAACNQFHTTSERLARWLLMTGDRMYAGNFQLTHHFLGKMLGVPRVGVTIAANGLQKKKLIAYSRGNIAILDRKGLENAACSCYRAVARLYSRK
jgi:CRP-like cAMP-binding protein